MLKVLLVAHWDWVLYNWQLPLAKALREHGYEVAFVCPFGEYTDRLKEAGFRWVHWSVIRRSLNPVREIASILHLAQIYCREQPDLVHHFTVKPNLYGSLAVKLVKQKVKGLVEKRELKVINTFMGLGFLFSSHFTAHLLRFMIMPFLRFGQHNYSVWTVCSSVENKKTLLQLNLVLPDRIVVICDSGIDTTRFFPNSQMKGISKSHVPIAIMAARLLWDKGVGEFVEAAKLLKQRNVNVEFWLAGRPDDGNPMCVPEEVLRQWHESGLIRWLGHCDNMPKLLQKVDIAVLPSYHEGVPRFLLEAAASGLPLVATDIEGCRMVVRHGENGFLVPTKDPEALADAIEQLVRDHQLRLKMGKVSREIAVKEFDEQKILEQWLSLYERVLKNEF